MESEVYIMLYTLNELHERKEVIRELAKKRRKELTVYGGVICDMTGLCSYDDYIELINSLTDDEFVGNYFTLLMNKEGYDVWTKLIDDNVAFEDVIKSFNSEYFMNEYRKKIEA